MRSALTHGLMKQVSKPRGAKTDLIHPRQVLPLGSLVWPTIVLQVVPSPPPGLSRLEGTPIDGEMARHADQVLSPLPGEHAGWLWLTSPLSAMRHAAPSAHASHPRCPEEGDGSKHSTAPEHAAHSGDASGWWAALWRRVLPPRGVAEGSLTASLGLAGLQAPTTVTGRELLPTWPVGDGGPVDDVGGTGLAVVGAQQGVEERRLAGVGGAQQVDVSGAPP